MTEDLELRTIRAFVAVVEGGDFTAAARTLRLTRSGVGKALARLEARLGVRLLHRTTRRVATTSDGAVFYETCVRLLADLGAAEDAVRQHRQEPRGVLKLSLPGAYGRLRLLPILQNYMRAWPMVGVEASFSDRIDDVVEEGLDLAIRIGPVEAVAGLVTRVVDRFGVVLCAAPDYLAARGTPRIDLPDGPDGLEGHDLLLFGRRGRIRPWPWPLPRAAPRSSRARARTILDSADAQRAFALAGLGIANLPDFLVAADIDAGRLVALRRDPTPTIDVHALYPDRRLLPARVRLFLDRVVAELRG